MFVAVEAYWGWRIDSLALLADAGHNLSDVAGLALAWGAALAGRMPTSTTRTYGYRRAGILAAFANAMLLLFAMGALAWEAMQRLAHPHPFPGGVVMAVAGIGIVINGLTAWLFMRGSQHDLNLRGAFLHMAADALVSAGVVVAGALALWRGWVWIDPVMSLLITLVIVWGTWSLLRQSLHLMFDGVPDHLDWHAVRASLRDLPGVEQVADLHIWAMGTSEVALTAHLVVTRVQTDDAWLREAHDMLQQRYGIAHATLQVGQALVTQACDLHLNERP
jgi:cobalt-zinc-cadmium efflux system protein